MRGLRVSLLLLRQNPPRLGHLLQDQRHTTLGMGPAQCFIFVGEKFANAGGSFIFGRVFVLWVLMHLGRLLLFLLLG